MKDNRYSRFINNTFTQYIMTLAQYIFPLITFPYLTRIFEPEMYGIVVYLTALTTFFQILVDYGFNLSATRDIAQNQSNKNYIGRIVGGVIQSKALLILISFVLYTVVIIFTPSLQEYILLSYLYFATLVLSVFLPDFMFLGLEIMEVITKRFLLSKTITTLLTFILVQNKEDVIWVPILSILGSLLAIFLTWYHIKKVLHIQVTFLSMQNVVNQIKNATIYFIPLLATTTYGILNTIILGKMNVPLNQIAYWGVSYNLIMMAQSLYSPIINSLFLHMIAARDLKLVKRLLIIFMPLIILTAVIVWLLAEYFILIIAGEQFKDAVPIFRMLLPVLVFSFPAMLMGFSVLVTVGKIRETTLTVIIASLFHLTGFVILIHINYFSVINLAILRSFTEFILMVSSIYYVFQVLKEQKKT